MQFPPLTVTQTETSLHFQLIVAKWRHMATYIWVKIDSGNGVLYEGNKPLPEPCWLIIIRVWRYSHAEFFYRKRSTYLSLSLMKNY